ncbi:MAG: hypothetical protein AB7V46_07350 [Thermomicrobiales bacterium]
MSVVVLLLVSALLAPALQAQEDLTGSSGSASTGIASEDASFAQETPSPTAESEQPALTDEGEIADSGTESSDSAGTQPDELQTGVGDSGDTGGESAGTESSGTPASGDGSQIIEQPADDSSAAAIEAANPTSADETGGEVEDPVLRDVVVTIFDCETDPGAGDPTGSADCAPVPGAVVNATNGLDTLSTATTDGAGMAVLAIEDGLTVQIGQEASTITSGYMALASSKEVVVIEGATTFLVNVRDSSQGRFQVASGQCFTLGEPRTEMMVMGPMVRAADEACGPLGGVEFTLTGGSLAGPTSIVTSGAGSWTGYLEPGEYSLARNGVAVTFDVEAAAITAVVSIDYVTGPSGTLTVERYLCSDGETNGVTVVVYPGGGGGAANASCVLDSKNVEVYSLGGASPMLLDLQGGSITVDLAADMGDQYVVRDASGAESEPFLLGSGESVQVVINEIRVVGSISAQLFHCDDPASNFEDATLTGYWTESCDPAPAGVTVTLRDGSGTVVSGGQTGSGGGLDFADILTGTYTLTSTDACAAFSGGADVRGGFSVAAQGSTVVSLFTCAKPTLPPDNDGGNNSGGNGGVGGNNSGGNSTEGGVGAPAQPVGQDDPTGGALGAVPTELFSIGQFQPTLLPTPKPKLYVMNLPGVGAGTEAGQESSPLWLMASVALALAAGFSMMAGRRIACTCQRSSTRR